MTALNADADSTPRPDVHTEEAVADTAATALCPRAAHQAVAMSRPTAVAARMMASGAPRTPAGTTPTRLRPSATDPAMKLARPRMDGSPASGPSTAAGGASVAAAPPAVASTVVIRFAPVRSSAPLSRAHCMRTPRTGQMCSQFESGGPAEP